MPHSSVRHSIAPTPEMPSTAKTAGVSATTRPIASTGCPVPVEVSLKRAHDADRVRVLPEGLGDADRGRPAVPTRNRARPR